MQYLTDDVRITGLQEVAAPERLLSHIPLTAKASECVFQTRKAVADIIHGRDPRLVVVVGPCSIHDPEAAIDYAKRLAPLAEEHREHLQIVMRVYFEKPRTTVGWKGLINDPHLNNSFDINHGLATARRLLADIGELGLGTGTEYLDPITPQYLGDLVSWGAIGARTTESQVHRQLASGLSCPVGFKNSTLGDVKVAVDAVSSANHQHIFLSVTKQGHSAIFSTKGNEDCHIILRGGGGHTNFDQASVSAASELLSDAGLCCRVMVDMSHANSRKDPENQLAVCADLSAQLESGAPHICGVMVESNIVGGRQDLSTDLGALTYGQSITDGCIDWAQTETCLAQLSSASAVRMQG